MATESLEVRIPATADAGVSLSTGDYDLGIGLPNSAASEEAEMLSDGTVAYPSDGASANAVIPLDQGVQLLSVIEDGSASESYAYELSFPSDHTLEETAEGGVQIVDGQGRVTVAFEPAWARDAKRMNVPTHYSVEGNTLTQVVEHKDLEGVTYPVVADPLPVVVIVVTAAAAIVVVAAALGVATWLVVSWWNVCQAKGMYPELSTRNGFTARCVY